MSKNIYNLPIPFFGLAPMANITTYPFAYQAIDYGADLVWTPMVHTDTIINNWPEAEKALNFKVINDYLVQIVGSDPLKFAQSVEIVEKNLHPLGIDLNFACPDKNIVKSGCGGALISDVEKMVEIIKAVRLVTKLPISVKTRAGWENINEIFDFGPRLWKAGISLLTIHPRTVKQGFKGVADWGIIKDFKAKYPEIYLCGSGDITNWQDGLKKVKDTNCNGVIIGRGALGSPWIFKELKERKGYAASLDEIKGLVLDLSVKAEDIWGEKGIIESRVHYANYFKGFPGAQEYRKEMMTAKSVSDIKSILSK